MIVHKGYKTELDPNNKQITQFKKHCGIARYAYNWALDRISKRTSKPNAISLHREWNTWKKENIPWWDEQSKCAPQESFRDLQKAFKNFFDKCKKRKKGKFKGKCGYPKFKSKRGNKHRFRLTGSIIIENHRIKLPRIGWIRLKEHGYIPVDAHILSATVSQRANRWFVSIQVKETAQEHINNSTEINGCDVGIKTLITNSDGITVGNPKPLRKNLKRLARTQRRTL
jgi:putative transposase